MNSEGLFTISRVACELGRSRQLVHLRFAGILPDGQTIVNGQPANAWRVSKFPKLIFYGLEEKRLRKGYRSIDQLLSAKCNRYELSFPFCEVTPDAQEKARRLRLALRPFVVKHNSPETRSAAFVQRGIEEYQRVFGYSISDRHWKALFDRTIARDAENQEWDRPEIYLQENPPRISNSLSIAAAREHGLDILEDALFTLSGRATLRISDRLYVWTKVCDELDAQLRRGANEKKAKRAILRTLLASGLVGTARETVRHNLNHQWRKYCANGRWLRDRRCERDQRKKLPAADREKLIARGAMDCGGRLRRAFRELRDSGELTAETLGRTIANPRRKSHMPASIAREITSDVKQVHQFYRSPREFELKGPYVPQNETMIAAGEVFQLDDVTLPIYFWEVDPESPGGIFFGRGQWILAIDVRSRLILGHALHSAPVYNMRIVRSLLLRVHDQFGLPETLLLERGMWRTAKIIKGDELDITHTEQGLREFGVAFQHRTKPRGKIIERVIGLCQNQMERLPGYVGRDERHDKHEEVQEQILAVMSGREHPSRYFFSKAQWLHELDSILARYNSEPQEGKLDGASPMECWNANLLKQGTVRLGSKSRYLLANHKKKVKVQRSGIRLPASLGGGLYYGAATGRFVGQQMLAWINPDELDAIQLTSLDRRDGPFLVERAEALGPIGASAAQLSRAHQQIAAHNDYARTQYRTVETHSIRRNFRKLWQVDAPTVELGQRIAAGAATLTAARQKNKRAVHSAQRLVRSQKLNVVVDAKNAERAAAAAELTREAYEDREESTS